MSSYSPVDQPSTVGTLHVSRCLHSDTGREYPADTLRVTTAPDDPLVLNGIVVVNVDILVDADAQPYFPNRYERYLNVTRTLGDSQVMYLRGEYLTQVMEYITAVVADMRTDQFDVETKHIEAVRTLENIEAMHADATELLDNLTKMRDIQRQQVEEFFPNSVKAS